MSLADSIFIFGLALIIFGPKKLPEIGRQIGKIMLEFRRASNEFKTQIEEELRSVEQADRQKQLASSEANPIQPVDASVTSSESLTVRPPSTGTTESTESPYKPVSTSDETTEPTASEPDWADMRTDSNAIQPPDASEASSPETTESLYKPVSTSDETAEPIASEPAAGDLKIAETAPDVPGPASYAANEHEDLQEQTTNHHG